MRFITEFKQLEQEKGQLLEMYKSDAASRLGDIIEESFDWQNPVHDDANWFRIEIEAFPMDKWVEFRKLLIAELPEYDAAAKIRIMNALSDLEKPGKPEHEQSKTTK
jgi:hypothetical protein